MKSVIGYFFRGLLLIAPIFVTGYVIFVIISSMDQLFKDFIIDLIGVQIPGLGLLIVLSFITLIGLLSSTLIFKPVFWSLEELMTRTPLIKIVYSSIRDLFSAFVSDKKKFNQPVLVNINKESGLQKLGFITLEDLSFLKVKDKVAVYLPHSYNFSGNLFIVNKDQVTFLEGISSTDAMKFIVSGGVADVEQVNKES